MRKDWKNSSFPCFLPKSMDTNWQQTRRFISINFFSPDHTNHKAHPHSILLSAHLLENGFHVENILLRLYKIHSAWQLKAHWQISKKLCFEKYCSCDKACQFLALQGTPWRRFLENLPIDNKFINNESDEFKFDMSITCWEEKDISTS